MLLQRAVVVSAWGFRDLTRADGSAFKLNVDRSSVRAGRCFGRQRSRPGAAGRTASSLEELQRDPGGSSSCDASGAEDKPVRIWRGFPEFGSMFREPAPTGHRGHEGAPPSHRLCEARRYTPASTPGYARIRLCVRREMRSSCARIITRARLAIAARALYDA
jgi:hypothetical protein